MIERITPERLKDLTSKEDVQLIDVREFSEYAAGHVPSAKLISLSDIEQAKYQIDFGKPVYLICKSGKRSEIAADKLIN
jgi:rhodanese-related sulfurtransferase